MLESPHHSWHPPYQYDVLYVVVCVGGAGGGREREREIRAEWNEEGREKRSE